ncbi:hypothetical protein UT300012_21710 [Paraclostridium bifermentans]
MTEDKLRSELEEHLFNALLDDSNFRMRETLVRLVTDNKDCKIELAEEDLKKLLMYFYDEDTSEQIIIEHKEMVIEVLDLIWSKEFDKIFELVLKFNYLR